MIDSLFLSSKTTLLFGPFIIKCNQEDSGCMDRLNIFIIVIL